MDTINAENYLFGFMGLKKEGINHILLELKKLIFYNWCAKIGVDAFCEQLKSKVKTIMIKEKSIALSYNRFTFVMKNGSNILQFMTSEGPTCK